MRLKTSKVNILTENVLVTGGLGFQGMALVETLVRYGSNVTVLYRGDKKINRSTKSFLADVNFLKGDLLDFPTASRAVKGNNIVFHLAASSNSRALPNVSRDFYLNNMIGTMNIAAAVQAESSKLIFASTSQVYGRHWKRPYDVNDDLKSRNPYGASKIGGEKLVSLLANRDKLNVIILRLCNIYGVGQSTREKAIVPLFVEGAFRDKVIYIHGTGTQQLELLNIVDLCARYIQVMTLDDFSPNVLNIGSGEILKVVDIANFVQSIIGCKIKYRGKDIVDDVNKNFGMDLSLTNEVLGPMKPITFFSGLSKYISWVSENKSYESRQPLF